MDAAIADYFIALADEPTCVALATNASLSPDHVQSLAATRLPAVLTALAYRDDLYEELIPFLIEHSSDFLRHWAIQQKSATLTDPAVSRRLLADPLPTIRALAVACHPWRRADLYDFARDPSPLVRLSALRHAQASDELVANLLADPAPEVATAAEELRTTRAAAARIAPKALSLPAPATAPKLSARSPSELSALNSQLSTAPRANRAEPVPKLFNQLKSLFWQ
jgi:hypothetical protein